MKQLGLFSLFIVLVNFAAQASTRVCVDHTKKTVTLSANYFFYGGYAVPEQVNPCVREINRMFNNVANVQINGRGEWMKVIFDVRGKIVSEEEAISIASKNTNTRTNLVRVDIPSKGSKFIMSEHSINGNHGYFVATNDLGSSTTCAHEFAHGLGLKHIDPCDWRGKGVPPIMAGRGCLVDKKYQYNPIAKAGSNGGTVDPTKRRVSLAEIASIDMGELDFSWVSPTIECASQGTVSNTIYKRDGNKPSY